MKLVGIQVTLSKKHAKTVLTCVRLYETMGTNQEDTSLEPYYVIIPLVEKHISRESIWHDIQSGSALQWKNNFSFYCLVKQGNEYCRYNIARSVV